MARVQLLQRRMRLRQRLWTVDMQKKLSRLRAVTFPLLKDNIAIRLSWGIRVHRSLNGQLRVPAEHSSRTWVPRTRREYHLPSLARRLAEW